MSYAVWVSLVWCKVFVFFKFDFVRDAGSTEMDAAVRHDLVSKTYCSQTRSAFSHKMLSVKGAAVAVGRHMSLLAQGCSQTRAVVRTAIMVMSWSCREAKGGMLHV